MKKFASWSSGSLIQTSCPSWDKFPLASWSAFKDSVCESCLAPLCDWAGFKSWVWLILAFFNNHLSQSETDYSYDLYPLLSHSCQVCYPIWCLMLSVAQSPLSCFKTNFLSHGNHSETVYLPGGQASRRDRLVYVNEIFLILPTCLDCLSKWSRLSTVHWKMNRLFSQKAWNLHDLTLLSPWEGLAWVSWTR